MRYSNDFLRLILNLSYAVRTIIVASAVMLCLILYMYHHDTYYSASFFIIPIALVSWLFPRREFFIYIGVISLIVVIYNIAISNSLVGWLSISTTSSLVTAISLFVEGLLIGSLREQVLLSDEASHHVADLLKQQQQLSQIRDQFILNVNHELRTPLTAVYGYLELLLEYSGKLDSATQATFLKNAMYSCEELQLLVSNVLDTIQVGNDKDAIYLEDLPVVDVIYEVVEHFDPRNQREYPVEIHVPPHLIVRANGQYFRQVLRNLLSNAFKYVPSDTLVSIEASLYGDVVQANHPSPEVCISVKDVGPGIPPEDIPRLFGQFVRLKRDVSGNVRGTGLGLYVSKQLVEAMGGRIWVESTGIDGEGSCFRFTLPCVIRTKVKAKTINRAPEILPLPKSESQPQSQDVR
ncbi:MAG: HAMP domain-containing histidine kinase [Ktedonobacteraceae bacterium]|nr:HAMP domain-containing histidine kinase [Ktedonobacteraceae bacterium]